MKSGIVGRMSGAVEEGPCQETESHASRALFVPICAGERAGLCQSALKWKMRDAQNLAGFREVTHYQVLTTMIRIPSLAPILSYCRSKSLVIRELRESIRLARKGERTLRSLRLLAVFRRKRFLHQ